MGMSDGVGPDKAAILAAATFEVIPHFRVLSLNHLLFLLAPGLFLRFLQLRCFIVNLWIRS